MSNKNAYFIHYIYEDGQRIVLDQDAFDSITISRTPCSSVVHVTYSQPVGATLAFDVHLDEKEHISIYGV